MLVKITGKKNEEILTTTSRDVAEVFGKEHFKKHYDADLRNFATLAQAKAAIEDKMYQEMAGKRAEFNKYLDNSNYVVGMENGQMYIVGSDGKQLSAKEVEAFKNAQQQYQNSFTQYLNRDSYAEQEINKILSQFINTGSTSANFAKLNITNSGGSSGSNGGSGSDKTPKWTTSNGDGVIGSGDTRVESHLDWIDKEKNLGRLSTESEIKELEKIKKYKGNTADEIYEINLRLYKANQELQEQATKKAEEAAQKKKEQYALANEAYKKLADDRIAAINKVTEAAEKSADKQIAAIDRQIEARKRLNEDKSTQAEIDAINAQLNYAQLDDLSRRELERKNRIC